MTDVTRFFGLLYLDQQHNRHANLTKSPIDPVEVYVSCACLAARSAQANGIDFSVFTNHPDLVSDRFRAHGLPDVPILTLGFSLTVPEVEVFYSAHFKIDVIAALASGGYGNRVALVDVDTVFLGPTPPVIETLPPNAIAAYDVSRPPTYVHWHRNMARDLSLVAGTAIDAPVWYGGEFLAGSPAALTELSRHIAACWPRYATAVRKMHHVGDETTVSAALNLLSRRGMPIVDVGRSETIMRWWPTGTRHVQPAFDEITDHFLLHLPADKLFLSQQAGVPFTKTAFLDAYRQYFAARYRHRKLIDTIRLWKPSRIARSGMSPAQRHQRHPRAES